MRVIAYLLIASVALAALKYAVMLAAIMAMLAIGYSLIVRPRETGSILIGLCVASLFTQHPVFFAASFAAFAGLGFATRKKAADGELEN